MAPSLPMSILAAMPTMCLSTPSDAAYTSAAAPVSSTSSKNAPAIISGSPRSRLYRAHGRPSSSPTLTGYLSQFAGAPASRRRFGYFGQPHDDAVGHPSVRRHS